MNQAAAPRFDALDAWRGIAACAVALVHLRAYSHIAQSPLLLNGYLWVDFFFVLSGFVIAANYQQRLLEGFSLGRFLLLRFGRLYPLHLFILLIYLALKAVQAHAPALASVARTQPFGAQDSLEVIAAQALLVHSMGILDFVSFNVPSWSISTEFWAYGFFAVSLILMRRYITALLLVIAVMAPAFIYAKVGHMHTTFDYGFIRCLYGFALGALTWGLYNRLRWTPGTGWEIAVMVLAIGFIGIAGTSALSIAAPPVFACVVLVYAHQSGGISRALTRPAFLAIGAWSYSIYMVHFLIAGRIMDVAHLLQKSGVHAITRINDRALAGIAPWQGDLLSIVYLALVIAVASWTYRLIEEPSRLWFRRRWGNESSKPARGPA